MTDIRVSQAALEIVWADLPPTLRLSQDAVEIVWADSPPTLRLSQLALEIVWREGETPASGNPLFFASAP